MRRNIRAASRLAMAAGLLAATPGWANEAAATSPVPPPVPLAAPAPAQQHQRPNVLVWMMDDVGFAQVSSFGGLVQTPNIDRVARQGLRYANYHTAPICSAARAAFLTGRMPHSVHIGGHSTAARDFPGYDARIPASAGTIAANLHAAGYATFALGKWDHLPNQDASPAGPFNYWATGQGFERFYGFLAADADNWNPVLVRDQTPVAAPARADYHLSADMAEEAIAMLRQRGGRDPARPFFMYWATGAAHAPHHAPQAWLDRYRGKFDGGWDKAREDILRAQIAQGLVPRGTRLAARPDGLPAWDSLSVDQKRLYARQMETFAAALSHADEQFGRILDALEASGELDNTMVIVTSDNGASAEGGPDGLYNEAEVTSSPTPGLAENLPFIDQWGGPRTYPHYAYGWAVAGDTPFRYYKQTTHEGGTRVPLVVAWPRGIAARGETRQGFVHVADIAPTILEAAGVPLAPTVNNVPQVPMEGQSFAASFTVPGGPRDGRAQYVELYGNKGLWWQGWSLVTSHRWRTWDFRTASTFDEPWELYDLVSDPGQTRNLAARHPERVAEMARMWEEQAARYNVAPLHNLSDTAAESMQRARADFQRRGGLWRYAGAVGNVPSALAPPVNTRSFTMTARLDLPAAEASGPVFAYGGQLGGMALYLDRGRPAFLFNTLAGQSTRVTTTAALPAGTSEIALELVRRETASAGHGDAGHGGMGSREADYRVVIRAGGQVLAERELRMAIPYFFGISEVFGVGSDEGSPVMAGWRAGVPLEGRVSDVTFDFNPRP